MTDEEVSDKFRMLAGRKLPKAQVEQAIATMWALDTAKGLDPLFEAVQIGRCHRTTRDDSTGPAVPRQMPSTLWLHDTYCFALRCRPIALNCAFCSSPSEA
jgi:hypothetical protein